MVNILMLHSVGEYSTPSGLCVSREEYSTPNGLWVNQGEYPNTTFSGRISYTQWVVGKSW